MIVCHVCGTENPDGSKFCEGCGVELSAAPVVEAAVTPVVEEIPVLEQAVATPELESSANAEIPDVSAVELPITPPPLPVPEIASSIETPVVSANATIISEPAFNSKATMEAPVGNSATIARLIPRNLGAGSNEGYILNSERMVVGRFDPSAGPVDIDLSGGQGENYISRRHAEVYLENGAWLVRDLGSTNGVYVKRAGQAQYSPRIIEPQTLSDGDEVAFGNMKFLFVNSSDIA
jgi:hypothetical protein